MNIYMCVNIQVYVHVCTICPESIQPFNMKTRDIYWRRYKIQEMLYVGQWCSVLFKVGTLGPHTVLPITISYPIVFSWISSTVWNLFPVKGDFSFGKSQKSQGTNSELWGCWITWVIWRFTKNLCMKHDA